MTTFVAEEQHQGLPFDAPRVVKHHGVTEFIYILCDSASLCLKCKCTLGRICPLSAFFFAKKLYKRGFLCYFAAEIKIQAKYKRK